MSAAAVCPGKRLTNLAEVDEALQSAALARTRSESEFLLALRSFWMDFPPLVGDAWSLAYAKHWDGVYEELAGRKYEISNEYFNFDVEHHSKYPYPFCTQDARVVSQHMMAIANIVGALALPPKSSVLEMGAGWGNTSLMLAQMGYDVTVVDINRKYGELIGNRADRLGVNIKFLCMGFDNILDIERTYDCVLFFESFHHSHDHLSLLDTIRSMLRPKGILALAGEPVNEALPYEWGLNPAGEALWQIRTHGWFELVFRESYLLNTLKRKGFSVCKFALPNNPTGTTYICNVDEPLISRKLGAAAKTFKTPALSTPYGKIIARASDASPKAGGLFEIFVSVANESKETWHGYGEQPVHLSYHWKKSSGDFLIYDGIRTELMKPELSPGETIEQQIRIEAPNVPGKFKLVLTLVQEAVCWFEDRGFESAVLDIEVS